jgi:N-terminal acetyltransferase B complex non-catalytic subunit
MAAIFARQNRCRELMDLWQAPPEHLKPVLKLHEQDLQTIKLKLLVDAKNWPLVTKFCLETIEEVVAKLATEDNSNSGILELCGRRWDLWSALLCALRETRTKEQCVTLRETARLMN